MGTYDVDHVEGDHCAGIEVEVDRRGARALFASRHKVFHECRDSEDQQREHEQAADRGVKMRMYLDGLFTVAQMTISSSAVQTEGAFLACPDEICPY